MRIKQLPAIRQQNAHLMIVEIDDALRVACEGAGIAGEEHLVIAQADDERAAEPGADDEVRKTRTDDRQAVGSLQIG